MSASKILSKARRSAGVSATRRVAKSRRHFRLRKKVVGSPERPRLVVTRTSRHLFVQVVDDSKGITIASVSTYGQTSATSGDKTERAKAAGTALAEAAKAVGVTKVVFDRGGNNYSGRIAAFATAARDGGLDF
jgi:large subunit ribosomal protein L18